MISNARTWLAALCLALLAPPAAVAQQGQELKVATRVIAPLVIEEKGKLGGFSIDLWNAIAAKLGLKTAYAVEPDVKSLLDAVRTGKADAGISAISITAARAQDFDFSQPMLNGGLQILVRGGAESGALEPLMDLLSLVFSPAILIWLGIALLLIIVPAHLIWILERGHKDGIIPSRAYFPGIFHALWWAASALAMQAEQMPRHGLARVLAVLWMFTAIVFVAFYTAQLTASLTVQKIRGAIAGPGDLPGKTVATTRGSTAAAYLAEHKSVVREVENIEDAYKALLDMEADAVVFDQPVVLYYAAHGGKGRVAAVGGPFRKEDYGIVFPPGSPLRKRVDGALLALREDGTYQELFDKWFGAK